MLHRARSITGHARLAVGGLEARRDVPGLCGAGCRAAIADEPPLAKRHRAWRRRRTLARTASTGAPGLLDEALHDAIHRLAGDAASSRSRSPRRRRCRKEYFLR